MQIHVDPDPDPQYWFFLTIKPQSFNYDLTNIGRSLNGRPTVIYSIKNSTVSQWDNFYSLELVKAEGGGAVLTESRLAIVLPCLPTCYRTCNYSGPPKYSARKFQTVYSLTQKWYNSPECAIHRYSWISNVLHRTILLYYYHHMRCRKTSLFSILTEILLSDRNEGWNENKFMTIFASIVRNCIHFSTYFLQKGEMNLCFSLRPYSFRGAVHYQAYPRVIYPCML